MTKKDNPENQGHSATSVRSSTTGKCMEVYVACTITSKLRMFSRCTGGGGGHRNTNPPGTAM